MTPRAGAALAVVVGAALAVVVAQTPTIYNPNGFEFEHELVGGVDITDHYQFGFVKDAGAETLLNFIWTYDVPKSDVVAVPPPAGATLGTFRVSITKLPSLPVGTTYRAVLYAVDAEGRASFPSNLTPEAFRFNACAAASSTGVQLPSIAIASWPALRTGVGVQLAIDVTTPNATQFIMIDFVGDGAPAWYYVVNVPAGKPSVAHVFFGPAPRAGRYEVFARVIDSGGCEATLPFGNFVTVSP